MNRHTAESRRVLMNRRGLGGYLLMLLYSLVAAGCLMGFVLLIAGCSSGSGSGDEDSSLASGKPGQGHGRGIVNNPNVNPDPEPDPIPDPVPNPDPEPDQSPEPSPIPDPEDPDLDPIPDLQPGPDTDPAPDGDIPLAPDLPKEVRLTWDPPTTDENGDPLGTAVFYRVYVESAADVESPVEITESEIILVFDLDVFPVVISVTAVDQIGVESVHSNTVIIE